MYSGAKHDRVREKSTLQISDEIYYSHTQFYSALKHSIVLFIDWKTMNAAVGECRDVTLSAFSVMGFATTVYPYPDRRSEVCGYMHNSIRFPAVP